MRGHHIWLFNSLFERNLVCNPPSHSYLETMNGNQFYLLTVGKGESTVNRSADVSIYQLKQLTVPYLKSVFVNYSYNYFHVSILDTRALNNGL